MCWNISGVEQARLIVRNWAQKANVLVRGRKRLARDVARGAGDQVLDRSGELLWRLRSLQPQGFVTSGLYYLDRRPLLVCTTLENVLDPIDYDHNVSRVDATVSNGMTVLICDRFCEREQSKSK